jgi:hypothetical protein
VRLDHVVGIEISVSASDGPADTGRTLEEEYVGALVPGVRVSLEVVLTIVDDDWAKFLHHAKH